MERRKTNGQVEEDEEPPAYQAEGLSLMERWRLFQEEKKTKGIKPSKKLKVLMQFIVVFHIPSEIYVFHNYIIPYYCEEEYSPMTIYYLKVISFFIGMMLVVNWCCTILYDTSFIKTKDQPLLPVTKTNGDVQEYFVPRIHESTTNGTGEHSVLNMQSVDDGLPWSFCEICEIHVPFRTHHCSVCNKCIMKKDHHCFITGTCIGLKNQRYFVVLTFYTVLAGILGGFITVKYIQDTVLSELNWVDLIFPVPVIHWMLGAMPVSSWMFKGIKGIHCLIMVQVYIEFLFGLVSLGFLSIQLRIITSGNTLYEYKKKLPVRNTNGFSHRMKAVFGELWYLNFIFPMTLICRQKDDGFNWEGIKVDKSMALNNGKQL